MSRSELQARLHLKDPEYFRKSYLNVALQEDLIERTIPENPSDRRQKYRLTEAGRNLRKQLLTKKSWVANSPKSLCDTVLDYPTWLHYARMPEYPSVKDEDKLLQSLRRDVVFDALLSYCELDTIEMVMISQHWEWLSTESWQQQDQEFPVNEEKSVFTVLRRASRHAAGVPPTGLRQELPSEFRYRFHFQLQREYGWVRALHYWRKKAISLGSQYSRHPEKELMNGTGKFRQRIQIIDKL